MHDLLVILEKGIVTDIVCCANGSDSSHKLIRGKDYSVLDIDKLGLEKKPEPDWLTPKTYKGETEEEEF